MAHSHSGTLLSTGITPAHATVAVSEPLCVAWRITPGPLLFVPDREALCVTVGLLLVDAVGVPLRVGVSARIELRILAAVALIEVWKSWVVAPCCQSVARHEDRR